MTVGCRVGRQYSIDVRTSMYYEQNKMIIIAELYSNNLFTTGSNEMQCNAMQKKIKTQTFYHSSILHCTLVINSQQILL